ncbi:Adhesion G protein-coupled receptor B3 like protein [Argiope bruennichi]|uniref:Adhesion G protein-coupled receptor B3 like protein n=1 Tax=Argiope bruennichi TaxID=94029 RepID=A0A8T0FDB6_ARGBR|nr:Adhesion G protein-coupled receptor B3 like protein [Argiope bruennichi]
MELNSKKAQCRRNSIWLFYVTSGNETPACFFRHKIGSTVKTCECPSGFEGGKCEKRKDDRRLLAQCIALGCTQTCGLTNHGDYKCTCLAGYHLAEDKKTCVEKGRTRYLIQFKMYDQNVDLAHLDATRYNQLKKGLENALLQLFQPRLYKAENLTVLSFEPGAVVQFHFFGEKEDSHQAKSIMEEALKSRSIGKYAVDRNYISFEWEPALSIQSIDASEKMPVVEDSEMSLACITQGSSAMQVRWFKDGAAINVQTSYRSMWTTLVPKNSKDQYTAILGFEKAHVLDSGEFICQVSDWGTIQNKSIQVSVVTKPQAQVMPLTATVKQGDRMVITCLSQDDVHGSFGYNWVKNNHILNPSVEPEMVEDLYPAGSRLLILSARASATYTCIVTSTAGSTRKDCSVTVISAKGNTATCLAEKYLENKFESLRMGYLITEVGTLMQELKLYLWNMRDRFHIAEGEPVVDLLEGLLDYQRKHGKNDESQFKNNSQIFLDIVSFLLDSPRLIQKQSHVIKLHQQILSHGLLHGSSISGDTFHMFQRSALVLEVGQVQNEGQRILSFPSRKATREVKNYSQPSWLTDSVELDFNTWIVENFQELNDSISIAVVFYKNFSAFLPERFLAQYGGLDMEYQLHSRIVAVAVQTGQRIVGARSSRLKVKARLAHLNHTVNRQIMWNISCGLADFSQGNVQFSMEGCQPIQTGNYSLCQCNHVGTYAVLLTTYAQPDELQFQDGFEVIAGIGCALCAFFVFLTFFILLVLWRKISGAITALKIQVCIALIGAYATILKALHESLTKEYYPYVMSLIQFFLLAAFSMQLCVGLTVYMEFVDMKGVRYPELKLATMGWAIPMIVVGATLAAQVPVGFRLNSWWIQMQTNYFYAYSISVIIITVLQIMLVTTVKSELKVHKKLETSKHSKSVNRSRLLNRSLVIIVFLLIVSVSSIMYINFDDELYKYAFSSSSAVLGFIVFLCYTVCSENAHSLCSSTQTIEDDDVKQEPRIKNRSGSFQSFLKPEIVSDSYVSSKIPETIEVDVRMEKLRKLRFQMCPEEIEWKEVDHLLVEKSAAAAASIVRDFTVHHQSSPLIVSKAKEAIGIGPETGEKIHDPDDPQWTAPQESDESVSSPFQLQQLDDSPRSSQFHIKDVQDMAPDGQESQAQFYELGVMQNTPPDILEPTKQAYFATINNSSSQQVMVNPCLTTFCSTGGEIGEQCVINTRKASDQCALVTEGLRTNSYSTFRPPANPPSSTFQSPLKSIKEDEKNESASFLKSSEKPDLQKPPNRSKTPSPSVKNTIGDKPVALKNPDIGDEPIVPPESTLKKKEVHGLQVPTPVVPSLEKDSSNSSSDPNAQPSKKGWSITTV